jgi:hypothetical protein
MKKFYSLAFLTAMLLAACTAEGVFDGDPNNIVWGSKSSSSLGSDPIGSCTVQGECYDNIPQSTCLSGGGIFSTSVCPSTQGDMMYCYDYDGTEDCTPISSYCRYASDEECTDDGGTVRTEAWCEENAYRGFYFGYCD